MTHTKKRILAMLLAVVLCFSALPFSVSADEISSELPTESTVESQPKESQAEETEESPPPAENAIILSDSSGDVPVLYAQDPFNTVKSEVEGGTNYMISVGVTRESIVRELEAHENDDFYLGTKYVGGDAQSPNGDTSYNSGAAGMNCAGFISYVLRKAGLDAETTMEIMHRTPVNQYGSGLPYGRFTRALSHCQRPGRYSTSLAVRWAAILLRGSPLRYAANTACTVWLSRGCTARTPF